MDAEAPRRALRDRARRAAWLGAAGLLGLALIPVLAAPGVPATCAEVLRVVEAAGEAVGPAEREACERGYEQRRASAGRLRWAQAAWCVRFAASVDAIGQC